jgi:hypothetical protein
MAGVSPTTTKSVKSRFDARKSETGLSRKLGQNLKDISRAEQFALTQPIPADRQE